MRVASVQSNVVFGNPTANAAYAAAKLASLASQGVELAVFPEAFLTGYCVGSPSEAAAIAIPRDDAAIETLRRACDEHHILAVVGFAEMAGGQVFNTAVLLEPGQEPRFYHKTHLPDLGLDKFVKAGDALPLFETRVGKIGILICFDLRPPEATRALALQGADVLVLPTNWPEGAEVSADFIAVSRASENRIFVVTCDRVGEENGFRFIGRSKIVHPSGRVLAAASDQEETLIADLDLADARQKRTVAIPGLYETEVFASRRPELYAPLVESI